MLYKGRVVDNEDETGQGQLRVHIPQIHGDVDDAHSDWYSGCFPSRSFSLPSIGEYVWMMPLNKACTEFVWMGWAPVASDIVCPEDISEPNDMGTKYKIVEGMAYSKGVPIIQVKKKGEIVSTPDRHTPLKTPGGITFSANDNLTYTRYNGVERELIGKKQRTLLTLKDDFKWGIEDPLGNHVLLEHIDGITYFSIGTRLGDNNKGFQLLHQTDTGDLTLIDKQNKNSVKMTDGKVILTSKDGQGDLSMKAVNAKDGEEPMVLGTQLKDLLDALYDALNTWIPMPSDGGAALKTALASFLASYAPYKASRTYLTEKAG